MLWRGDPTDGVYHTVDGNPMEYSFEESKTLTMASRMLRFETLTVDGEMWITHPAMVKGDVYLILIVK